MLTRMFAGAAVLVVALDQGGYSVVGRHSLAVVVWWTLLLAFGLGFLPPLRTRELAAATVALAGLSALTFASLTWGASAENAWLEADRVLLALGIAVLAATVATYGSAAAVADGLALGIAAVAAVALASRVARGDDSDTELATYLPAAAERLSFPLGYWNGLAYLLALAFPLLLRVLVAYSRAAVRVGALSGLAVVASALYLTGSRGGVAAAVAGSIVFVALELRTRVRVAASAPSRRRALAGIAAALAVALALVVVAVDPVERVEAFAAPPTTDVDPSSPGEHLVSGGGGGRWQLWSAAVAQFEEHPLSGDGAGTFEAWWAQHGTLPIYVRHAHSLYLELLGELGPGGALLIVVALGAGLLAAVRRRTNVAAAAGACVAAYAGAAALDWVWELPVVSGVAFAALGLAVAPAAPRARTFGRGTQVLAAAGAALALAGAAVPLVGALELERSEAAARGRDVGAAIDAARAARAVQPWASSARVQLALAYEDAGRLVDARASIAAALVRNDRDWRAWLVAGRLAAKAGDVDAARRSLCRAAELNPRSPLFSGGGVRPTACSRREAAEP